jgi:hypothetical protein
MLMRQQTRVALFQGKNIPRNMEQREILTHSVGIPSVPWNGKSSEFRPNHFAEKKHSELVNSFRTILRKIKMLGIRFRTFRTN